MVLKKKTKYREHRSEKLRKRKIGNGTMRSDEEENVTLASYFSWVSFSILLKNR